MAVSHTLSKIYQLIAQKIVKFSHPVLGISVRGEVIGVKQRPSVTKNRMIDGAMR